MKNTLLTLLFLCVLYSEAHAQDKFFEAGYVILSGDTLPGYILRSDEIKLSHQIEFKSSLDGSPTVQYKSQDIQGFGFISDKLFFSPVEVELSRDGMTVRELRFAKNIARGETSLYRLQLSREERSNILLKDNKHIYVFEKNGEYHTLGQYEFKYRDKVGTNKKYLGVLRATMEDCLNIEEEITEELLFKDLPLMELVQKYNSCKNPAAVTTTYNHKVKPFIRHGIAVSYNKVYMPAIDYDPRSQGYSAGYFWDITKLDLSRTLSQTLGVNYLYLHYNTWDSYVKEDIPVSRHILRLPVLVQLNLNNTYQARVNPFFNLGLTGQFFTNRQMEYLEFLPFITVGGGAYFNKLRVNVLVENEGFSWKQNKIVSVGLGWRLDNN